MVVTVHGHTNAITIGRQEHSLSMDVNPATSQSNPAVRKWDVNTLLEKVAELQDTIVQAQERSLLLSAQTRELERIARDAEDLRVELTAQGLLLADKTKENKLLHQELSRVTTVLDLKLHEVEELKTALTDLQHQLKTRESERDLLAAMLSEAENAQRHISDSQEQPVVEEQHTAGWLRHFKGKSN